MFDNTTEYFDTATTVQEIKILYRELCFTHHPDLGGDVAIMQVINAQYQAALRRCDGQTTAGSDNKTHTYHYYADLEQTVADKLQALVALKMITVDIMLIGSWVWVTGTTRPHSHKLGKHGLGLSWHHKRSAWYWHAPSKHRTRHSGASLERLANTYGYRAFGAEEPQPLQRIVG